MRILVSIGGVLAFLGFLLVAYGMYWLGVPPPPAGGICYGSCEGLWWNQIIAIGVGLIGFALLLALLGVAVKGPSREWSDLAPTPPAVRVARAPGYRYACPACGGDVYSSETTCPECGRQLTIPGQSPE